MTPVAAKRASLQKYSLPYSGSVKNGKFLDIEYQALLTHIHTPVLVCSAAGSSKPCRMNCRMNYRMNCRVNDCAFCINVNAILERLYHFVNSQVRSKLLPAVRMFRKSDAQNFLGWTDLNFCLIILSGHQGK